MRAPSQGDGATKSYGYSTTGPGACSPVDFISMHVANTDATIANTPEDVNVDINGTGSRPLVLRSTSSLSKNGGRLHAHPCAEELRHGPGHGQCRGRDPDGLPRDAHLDLRHARRLRRHRRGATVTRTAQFTVPDGTTGNVTFTANVTSTQGCWKYDFIHSMTDLQFTYLDEKHCAVGSIAARISIRTSTRGPARGPPASISGSSSRTPGPSAANGVIATLVDANNNSNVTIATGASTYTLAAGAGGIQHPAVYRGAHRRLLLGRGYHLPFDETACGRPRFRVPAGRDLHHQGQHRRQPHLYPLLQDQFAPGLVRYQQQWQSGAGRARGIHRGDPKHRDGRRAVGLGHHQRGRRQVRQYTTITAPTTSFGTITAGQSKRNTTTYKFDLTSDAVTETYYFPVSITSSCSAGPFTGTIPITVYKAGGA